MPDRVLKTVFAGYGEESKPGFREASDIFQAAYR
jgi:hypothetical protein